MIVKVTHRPAYEQVMAQPVTTRRSILVIKRGTEQVIHASVPVRNESIQQTIESIRSRRTKSKSEALTLLGQGER